MVIFGVVIHVRKGRVLGVSHTPNTRAVPQHSHILGLLLTPIWFDLQRQIRQDNTSGRGACFHGLAMPHPKCVASASPIFWDLLYARTWYEKQ